MQTVRESVISIISSLPDEALWALYLLEVGPSRLWRRVRPKLWIERRSDTRGNLRSLNFLCFVGVNWFSQFMIRKMQENGFYCFTRPPGEFRGWRCNYAAFSSSDLPVDNATQPDFILVDHIFFRHRRRVFGHKTMRAFINRVSRNRTVPVIGIDSSDTILSKLRPEDIDCFDLVLKGQGLPKDRELMNWEIGVRWGLNRKERIRRLRFQDKVLSRDQIDRFKLSFDLGSAAYCDIPLSAPPPARETHDVFFVGVFDSLNRLEALKIAYQHFKTVGWLQMIDGHPVVGIESWKADPQQGRPEDRAALIRESRRLYQQHRELFRRARIPPRLFRLLAQSCRIMPAFSGIGELGMRHYQAFEYGKAMVCEDVSHIETIFPFENGKNCMFVADRLEDFEEKARWLLDNEGARQRIATTGFRQLQHTYRDGNAIFQKYFLDYLGIERNGPSQG